MSRRSDLELLQDIKTCIDKIFFYTKNLDYRKFSEDYIVQDAVVRNLEIIGEATKNTSRRLRNKHKDIPWKKMSQQRDKLIHHYSGVDYDIVWGVIKKSLPELASEIDKAIQSETHSQQ